MKKNKTLFTTGLILISICIICGAISLGIQASEKTSAKTVDQYMQEYGGNPDVYAEILALTDCATLQQHFDTAENNLQAPGTPQRKWGMGYMKASDDRMRDVGCYK